MRKIGIMTFHRSHNCGSIMQAYALQKVLSEPYHSKVEFIDFSNVGQQRLYAIFDRRLRLRSIVKNIILLPFSIRLAGNRKSYEKYIKEKLSLSNNQYHENEQLVEGELGYDIYVTGSDQVWNITIPDSDDAYFLPFVNNHPKIGYALSQGAKNISIYADNPKEYKDFMSDFDHLSVREPNGHKWLEKDFGIKSEIVLDPTLLLDGIDYKAAEMAINEELEENKYIFVYATELSRDFENLIQGIAKAEGLKIVVWQPYTWIKKMGWFKGYILPREQNPGKYLTLMKNAKYVFTASFHGVIFAMQYKKNFWVLHNDGMNFEKDDRILSLLDNFKFMDRIIKGNEELEYLHNLPDYTYYEKKLQQGRKKSLEFLDRALK